jgi:hypothetical protein
LEAGLRSGVATCAFLLCGMSVLALDGCISVQALEPVTEPPVQFRSDATTKVEFLHPTQVGLRCAQRGATFLGLPAITAGACADDQLITMIDPCQTFTAGPYARLLCDDARAVTIRKDAPQRVNAGLIPIAFAAGAVSPQNKAHRAGGPGIRPMPRTIAFLAPDRLTAACGARDLPVVTTGAISVCADDSGLFISNPCTLPGAGWYERALCHELGHVNGWAADHSSAGRHALRLPPASESPEARAHAGFRSTDPLLVAPELSSR